MSLNDKIFNHAIGHHIRVQRYGAGEADKFQKIMDDAHSQVRDAVVGAAVAIASQDTDGAGYAALIAALLLIFNDAKANLQAAMEGALQDFVENEADNEVSMLERMSGMDIKSPSKADLASVITDVAFQGRYLDTWIEDLIRGDAARVQATIISGMQRGNDAVTIANALGVTAFGATASMLQNLVRTIWNGVTNWTRLMVMQANDDLIGHAQWHATLDEVTCETCAALDGQVFRLDEIDPPPAHPSCRCFLVAIFLHMDRVMRSARGKTFKRLKAAQREMFTGKPPAKMRYATWLTQQPAAVQNEALGPTRAALFRKGKLKISRFVNAKGHILTIKELKKRDAAAFRRAGL